ncbi:MAG TPA: multiheme c-type cytochrome [Steroidobacteraceae bacterium]|jgi:hypothetical protein
MRSLQRTALAIGLCAAVMSAAGQQSSPMSYKHLGVGSCASSVCHGKSAAQPGRNVALNEYTIWSSPDDFHSKAYRTLSSPRSQAIAAKLGLPSAAGAAICLDCHADNVPVGLRGPKFQLSDGVSCEACHGGAEKWIETHTQKTATHRDNLAKGMYASEQPLARAELCLSCHMGTRNKFATHVIMGAGHPRLYFELEVFTYNQPPHFVVDEDYITRKGRIEQMNLWVTGQIENARRYLELLQTRLVVPDTFLPEFALYDCFSCHHPMDRQRWTRARAGAGIQPGTLRLQRDYLVMLQAITEVLAPGELPQLTAAGEALLRAGQKDPGTVREQAQKLHTWIDSHDGWTRRQYAPAEIARVRKTVLRYATQDRASDFSTAEQSVMCVETLSYALGDHDRHKAALDSLYGAIKSPSGFDPTQFAAAVRAVDGQF